MDNTWKSIWKLLLYIVQTKYSTYKGKNMACKFLPSDRKFDDYGHSYYNIIGVGPKILDFKKVYKKTHRRSGLLISKIAL